MTDEVNELIDKANELLKAARDKTNCGYCKTILNDTSDILDNYKIIVDKAILMDKLAHEEQEFLHTANSKADEMIEKNYYHMQHEERPRWEGRRPRSGPLGILGNRKDRKNKIQSMLGFDQGGILGLFK